MTNTRNRKLFTALVTAAVAAAVVAGCSRGGDDGERAAPPSTVAPGCGAPRIPGYPQVDPCAAESVLAAAATVVFSWDPQRQQTQGDSFNAAADLLDPAYLRRVGDSASVLAPVTGATWARWMTEGITVTADAHATGDDHPSDTATAAYRVMAVRQQITYPDGRPAEPPRDLAVYMAATRTGPHAPWRVSLISPR